MLMLLFQLQEQPCALHTTHIEEILPYATLRPLVGAPPCIRGVLNWRGNPIIALDPAMLLGDPPTPNLLSTRMVALRPTPTLPACALILKRATEIRAIDPAAIRPLELDKQSPLPLLGHILLDHGTIVQIIDLETLLGSHIRTHIQQYARTASAPLPTAQNA